MTSPARVSFLASAAGLGALALHAALRGEPGLAVIGALSAGWGVLVTTGVICPWLEMYGRVVSHGLRVARASRSPSTTARTR